MENIKNLLDFIKDSPSCFHAINNIGNALLKDNFILLSESEKWNIKRGQKYFVKRNDSSIIAFTIPTDISDISYNISASHSDSPTFKVKPNFELEVAKAYLNLNTEVYGGPILSTWLDRALSLAGRIVIADNKKIVSKLINIDKDLLVIPNIAPHMNPDVNGMKYNAQTDMLPVYSSLISDRKPLKSLLSEVSNVKEEEIISYDLFVYNRDRGHLIGANNEFILAPQLDDLECAFGCLQGFLGANNQKSINVYCCFDNEEVGSRTKQGAGSKFLIDILTRINTNLGFSYEDLCCALSSSLMVSADNAHAIHPGMPTKTDALNKCILNGGIVIKHNANQNYTSDAISTALFKEICRKANVKTQDFTNRSDIRGGGTLGSISTSQVSINSVDIGLPQLAMHSASETAGSLDLTMFIKALKTFYSSHIKYTDNIYTVE